MAMATRIAFSKDARVMMSEGFKSSHTISTMRRPAEAHMRMWLTSSAGMEDVPGSVMPITSAMAVMVEAVPIVMQWPWLRAMPPSMADHSASEMLPARRSSQNFQASLPEPSTLPFQLPRSIGPAGTKMAGTPALVAPISSPGVVLSQPPIRTTPSTGCERISSSTSMASRLR